MKTNKTIRFYQISSFLLMLGVIHSALTPVFYKTLFSVDALWFFGTGLSLVFLGMLNIATSKVLELWLLRLTLLANIIGTAFSIIVLSVLLAPQAIIGTLFHLIVLFACYFTLRQVNNAKQQVLSD